MKKNSLALISIKKNVALFRYEKRENCINIQKSTSKKSLKLSMIQNIRYIISIFPYKNQYITSKRSTLRRFKSLLYQHKLLWCIIFQLHKESWPLFSSFSIVAKMC